MRRPIAPSLFLASALVFAVGCANLPKFPGSGSKSALGENAPGERIDPIAPVSDRTLLGYRAQEEGATWWDKTLQAMTFESFDRGLRTMVGQGPNENLAKVKLNEGDQLFAERRYAEAVKKYKQAANRWPNSVLEEDALFMLGESYFFSDQYAKASDAYAKMTKKYEGSRHMPTISSRHFAIARYWMEMAKSHSGWVPNLMDPKRPMFSPTGGAMAIYRSIWLNDPRSEFADDALMATANHYFLKHRYGDAAREYDLLRKQYAQKSENLLAAHLLGLQSWRLAYEGPQYDATPLKNAEELCETTLTQFPTELGDEHDRLMEARRLIRLQWAERDWATAEYYYHRKYYRAARHYYDLVIRNFADTPLAANARQRMIETNGLPPEPPSYFKWITRVLPETKRL